MRSFHDLDSRSRPRLQSYGLALGIAAFAVLLALAVSPAMIALPFLVPFLIAALGVAAATAVGGRGPGILALVLAAVAGAYAFYDALGDPRGRAGLSMTSLIMTTTFLLVGGVLIDLVARRRDRNARIRHEHERQRLSAEISTALDQTADFEAKLAALSRLFVPAIADWATIVLVADGAPRRLAISHADPMKADLAKLLAETHTRDADPEHGLAFALRTGEAELVRHIEPTDPEATAGLDERRRETFRALGIRSFLCVPIRRDTETIGGIELGMAESGRYFDEQDLALVTSLAARIASALENARLYHEAEVERGRAETASRAKDEFLAMLGHELRNPLAPIRTALELMALRDPNALRNERTVIERQVRQLVTLVDDLLDVSRITRGMFELEREPVDMLDVVTKGIETASPLVESRQHELFVDVDAGLLVLGDQARLAQVVSNLVTNAAKYTEPGGRITVVGRRVGSDAVLRVRDNGIGIPAEMLDHVFDMFVQAPQAIDRARGGLGLGLAIVKGIIDRHGGTVTATSAGPNQGSELVVRIPALPQRAIPATPPTGKLVRPVSRGRVLVVDDNPDALAMLSDALERRGYTIARAHDGPSALAIASRVHPEVALLDIGLPVMDGYELGRRLHEEDSAMKLVAVTGYGRPGDFERSHEAGFAAHLVKPISLDRVQATIESLVG